VTSRLFLTAALAVALPLSAQAASTTPTVPAPPASTVHSTSIAHMAGKADVAKFTYADVVGRIGGADALAGVDGVTADTSVKFIELHTLKGYKVPAFSAAQTKALAALAAAVKHSTALAAKVRKAGFLPADIVAVVADPSGTVFVFINL